MRELPQPEAHRKLAPRVRAHSTTATGARVARAHPIGVRCSPRRSSEHAQLVRCSPRRSSEHTQLVCGAHHGAPPSTPNWCVAHHGAPTIRHLGSLWRSEGGSSVQRMRWRRLRVQVTWFLPMWRVIGTLRWSKLLYIGVSAVCGSRERSRERFRVSTLHLCEPLRPPLRGRRVASRAV